MIYLLVTIDTECDKGPRWRVQKPMRFEAVTRAIPERLQPLFERYGIKPTYLLSPEVIADTAAAATLQHLGDKVELGTHLHGEYVEPLADWQAEMTATFQSQYPAAIERQKLENLTLAFTRVFGYAPTSFRAGRFGIGRQSLSLLQELGYRVDSSVTPYLAWHANVSHGVSFLGAPLQPYFPSREDFRKPGTLRILEVPVTVHNRFWQRFPGVLLRRLNPLNRCQSFVMGRVLKVQKWNRWFRPTFATGSELQNLVEELVAQQPAGSPLVLNMMFHNVEFWPGTSPYAQNEAEVGRLLQSMEQAFEFLYSRHQPYSVGLGEMAQYHPGHVQ
ncbi:MAG: hypothetical protein ONB48_15815 [candidate division KSB1 bacterium]|nr:hypothetical protein [candidate division KSB1 bacterium]MDZ7276106.1 hypothetical protein [candidate division KSB1 bacterium]MDZ7287114.1 hypothetical protein [candidate division KSB1 bacterium]MDZ7296961.1 hypothetical protein [candidate division KSB1 bacterium]MDZ7307147.1 hypothetical protein [candidate division KSB1 bacterium]